MKYKILLLCVIVVASVVRLWSLDTYPSGLNADEAALGYNAYSLIQTGRDEHGHLWPVNLESFGDFKPAGYTYLLIPLVKAFGLSEWVIRLPSALMGILAVVFIYLLVKEILDKQTALIAAIVLAVLPWHIHFSRGAWEVNVATTLILIGLWAVIKWLKTKRFWYLVFCVLGFTSSMYVYQSARIIAPFLGLSIVCLYWQDFWRASKQSVIATLVLAGLLFPLALSIIRSDVSSRLSGVGLLADIGPVNRANELRGHYSLANPPFYVKFLYNRVTGYAIQFAYNYLSHFDGNFLFVNGDAIERNKTPETGLLYLTDFGLVAIGLLVLLKKHTQHTRIVWLWLFIAPLAAAITFQVPHALRSQSMIIPLTIIMAVGIGAIIKSKKILVVIFLSGLFIWQIGRYLHEYYIHYPKEYPSAWEYGFKDVVGYVNMVQDKYENIFVTEKYDQPYILFLYYQNYSPKLFQNNHVLTVRDRFNFSTVRGYGKYHFSLSNILPGSLVIATPDEVPNEVSIIKTIDFPNGSPAFEIYVKN